MEKHFELCREYHGKRHSGKLGKSFGYTRIIQRATVLILILSVMFSSCATIVTGTTDSVSFDSRPRGATVSVDGAPVGVTPCQADVGRG